MDPPPSADRAPPATTHNAGRREMMYCHECQDEWYRDQQHGIICPHCGSEFTEIIEDDNDPRDMGQHDHEHGDDDSLPSLEEALPGHPHHDHHPWQHANDPDEADISTMRFQPVGPGRYHLSATIHRTLSPATLGINSNGPTTIGGFTSVLTNLLQGAVGAGQQQHGQHAQAAQTQGDAGPRAGEESAPGVHRFTYTGGARLHPRDAHNPEPHMEPLDDINNVLSGLLTALGEPPRGRQHGPGAGNMPMNPLMGLFAALSGGQHGDFVYSQEALDRIVSQLMEQTATNNAPGPASPEAIDALPRREVSRDMLGAEGRAECSICMDEVNIGEEVTELPCSHWFHHPCISAWLLEHDTCPHCRKGISKSGENAHNTAGGSTPAQSSSMPGAFDVTGGGTAGHSYLVPENASANHAPNQGGAYDGSSAGSGNGLGDRLRRGLFGPPQ